MGDLHGHRHAIDQDDLVAPVKLIGLARCQKQRHRRRRSPLSARSPSSSRSAGEHHSRARATPCKSGLHQLLAGGLAPVAVQEHVELVLPRPDLRLGLSIALIGDRCLGTRISCGPRCATHASRGKPTRASPCTWNACRTRPIEPTAPPSTRRNE